jgi:hypothetical protein
VSIPKPYYRIWRPFPNDNFFENDYVLDHRNAADAIDLIRGYHLLERELFGLFDFVEPADANWPCYSHQLYALLLRASTEFEANAKAILFANGYTRSGNFNINDYYKIEPATRLSEYLITIPIWQGIHRVVQPFASWNTGPSLSWYQSYNRVKHSRSEEFESASLQNVVAQSPRSSQSSSLSSAFRPSILIMTWADSNRMATSYRIRHAFCPLNHRVPGLQRRNMISIGKL